MKRIVSVGVSFGRSLSAARAFSVMLAVLLLAPGSSAMAQRVTEVEGVSLTISIGAESGVAVGMTGRVFRVDEVKVYEAEFEITEVSARSSTARITKQAGVVSTGMSVELDHPSKASNPEVALETARPSGGRAARTADELLADANRLYDAGEWTLAASDFREYLLRFPGHRKSEYARKLAAVSESRSLQAEEQERAAGALGEARRYLAGELWQEAAEKAEEALALDPANSEASAIRQAAAGHLGVVRLSSVEPVPGETEAVPRESSPPGTVLDPQTGLIWTQRDNGTAVDWEAAVRYCDTLVLGGFADWTLPTIDQLAALYSPAYSDDCTSEALRVFKTKQMTCHVRLGIDLSSIWQWSSNTIGRAAWYLIFSNGARDAWKTGSSKGSRALCVRRSVL